MTIIATWNVNSVRTRLSHLGEWIQDRSPDIVLLQELKCVDEAFPYDEIERLGYNVAVHGQKSYNGVAILSKEPLEDVKRGIKNFDDDQARYIQAQCGDTLVASVYVPNGQSVGSEKFEYKMRFFQALQNHARDLLGDYENVIIGGDYNVAPHPTDGHTQDLFLENRILCSLEERQALHGFVNQGFLDGYRLLYPDSLPENQNHFSWWDYRAGSFENNKGYRIDHLYCSPRVADHITSAGIDSDVRSKERPSDHVPVWIDF